MINWSEIFTYVMIGLGFLLVGGFIGSFIAKKTRLIEWVISLVSKEDKEKNKILNDPELLKKKLEEKGKWVDDGKDIIFKIEEVEGKKRLIIK